jgi:hypothetical protein
VTADDTTVKTSNVSSQQKSIYSRPTMEIRPRRLISLKHGDSVANPEEEDTGMDEDKEESSVPTHNQVTEENSSTAFEQHMFEKRKQHSPQAPRRARWTKLHDVPDPQENVLSCDNAADQCVIGQGFKVLFHTGQFVKMDGAMAGMNGE